jgi:hypothetical protein
MFGGTLGAIWHILAKQSSVGGWVFYWYLYFWISKNLLVLVLTGFFSHISCFSFWIHTNLIPSLAFTHKLALLQPQYNLLGKLLIQMSLREHFWLLPNNFLKKNIGSKTSSSFFFFVFFFLSNTPRNRFSLYFHITLKYYFFTFTLVFFFFNFILSLAMSLSSKPLLPSVSPSEHHDSHVPFQSFTTHQAWSI